MKEPSLKGLVNNFKHVLSLGDARYIILTLQLYVEHYVNEIVLEQVKEPVKKELKEHLTFPQKLRIIERMKIIDGKHNQMLQGLNKIRDVLVHELVITSEKIEEKLRGINFGFIYNIHDLTTPSNSKKIDLEKEYRVRKFPKYDQLKVSCLVIISYLYHALKNLKGEEPKELIDIDFETNKEGKEIFHFKCLGKVEN